MKNYKEKIVKLKKKYNLDMLDLCKADICGLEIRLIIGKNNYYFMRDMENQIITNEVFDIIMEMLPEMIEKLNEIMEEDR